MGLLLALLGACVGGLLLNLMPCVFPVLAIKVLGFSRPGSNAREHRANGLAYTAGVVLSFVLLGALLMALRAAGEQLGWGFQLQSPWAVTALAVLFTLLGLNLAGLFEFGRILPSAVMNLQSRHPTLDAALSGVLAVAIASPCTAPFMGASLGLAIGLPLWQALPVFAAMGLGMALPYLGASLWPAWAQRLPRPGAWMVTFKQAMAFPMFATVVWLVWVLGQQSGIDGASSLLALLLALAGLVWALGQSGRARTVLGTLALAALLGIAASPLREALQAPAPTSTTTPGTASTGGHWQPWSAAEVAARQAQGQTVFVDFTAAWCVTCQYNKKTTLADARVLAAFDAKNVRSLRADWTRRDAAITQALAQLGRNGVPVYVVYAPGQPPVVLSELPSVQDILSALP
jgi:thiol:disulfide interchange protein DsbD